MSARPGRRRAGKTARVRLPPRFDPTTPLADEGAVTGVLAPGAFGPAPATATDKFIHEEVLQEITEKHKIPRKNTFARRFRVQEPRLA